MTETPGRRPTNLGDPTAEDRSDPIPESGDGGEIIERQNPRRGDTPRRYEAPERGEAVLPSDDSTLNTQI